MPSKKQPAAKTATTAAAKSATEQQGAAPPPADQQPAEQATASTEDNAAITCDLSDLGRARALPEAPGGPVLFLGVVEFAPGSIEQFADEDGRTMRIVNVDGVLHKFPAEPAPSEPDPAEAQAKGEKLSAEAMSKRLEALYMAAQAAQVPSEPDPAEA